VIDNGDKLREAFETHEHLAPDPAKVYARVQELARNYRWRRRGVQAAGGAVLGAGLLAGVINLPALVPHDYGSAGAPAVAFPLPSESSSAPAGAAEIQKELDTYAEHGYGYDDAVRLAKLWNLKDDTYAAKAEAGRRLLAGETLPIQPTPDQPVAEDPPISAKDQKRLHAYFGAGYDWDDAVRLAKIWKLSDPYDAKVMGGKKLLAGDKLPVKA
jgi:hypothetical protein